MCPLNGTLLLCLLFDRCVHPWQESRKRTALTDNTAHTNSATLSFDDALGQGQTKAGSLVFLGRTRVKLLERHKESLEICRCNAFATILYFHQKRVLAF